MTQTRAVNRIAWVGGSPGWYVEADVTKYFRLVVAKYPDAVHIVGSDSGGEAQVQLLCKTAGKKLIVPPVQQELPDALWLQVENVVAEADAVVCMGTAGGKRVKLAVEVLKRVDGCREVWNKRHLFTIADPTPPKKKAAPKKAKSKKQRMAKETA